jgi:hypothetical protein
MRRFTSMILAVSAWALLGVASMAEAEVPIPTTSTPTVHGGTPLSGNAVAGDIGFAQLRAGVYFGSGDSDIGIEAALPTFGDDHDGLPGWGQRVGIDVRAPYRLRLSQWPKATGSFKIGPYFHVGDVAKHYDGRMLGLGVVGGFVTDIALPKIFKLIIGIEQQFGMLNYKNGDGNTEFAAATWLDFGLEAFWKNIFFTLLFNAGAQYGSNELYYDNHALFRQMLGAGYKWK